MAESEALSTKDARVRVWDLPTRIVHWLLAILVLCSWLTDRYDKFELHKLSGYALLTLILFRIYWGFFGSSTARFGSFVTGPRAFWNYGRHLLKRGGPVILGHNPMGAWSVLALLALLLVQVVLGLFAVDPDGVNSGPLDGLVSFETGRKITHLHGLVFNILLVFIAIHVIAVLFYLLYKRENLIVAMVRGFKTVPTGENTAQPRFVSLWLAIPGLLIAAGLVYWIVTTRF